MKEAQPDYRTGRVMGVDGKGNTFYLPRSEIHVPKTDVVARAVAAGAFLAAAGALAATFFQRDSGSSDVEQRIGAVQTQQAENIVGDCIHENMVRDMFGERGVTLGQCIQEREDWANELLATPTPPGGK